jgi:hypothetical protein
MSITVDCDSPIAVRTEKNKVTLTYKTVTINYWSYPAKSDTMFDCSFTINLSRNGESSCTIRVEEPGMSVEFEFPYTLQKVAYDNYIEVVETFRMAGLVNLPKTPL